MFGADQTVAGQLLQNLRHQRGGNAVLLSDFARAAGVRFTTVQSQMFDGDQAVVSFFRKLKHPTYAQVRIQWSCGHMRLIRSPLVYETRQKKSTTRHPAWKY